MKAVAIFPAKRQARVIECEQPKTVSPTEVKLRILDSGICGTDKEIAAFQYGTPPQGSEYLIIGHESLGEVVEVGAAVSRVEPGDLVVPMVRRPCPHADCLACRSDRQDFCYTGDFSERGIKGLHGFLTEFVVEEEKYLIPVPRELREVAVLIEPLTIAEKSLAQVWQVQQRLPWNCPTEPLREPGYCHQAVVLGGGPVGLLGAMLLRVNGFTTTVYSREPDQSPEASFVRAIGATYVSSLSVSPEHLREQVGNIDLIYEATGASKFAFQVMEVLGTNGVFVFTGVPGRKASIELDAALIMRNLVLKNQVVFGTVNAGREAFENAVRDLGTFMNRWPEAVRSLITGRYPIEAFHELLGERVGGIKNVITFDRSSA